MRSSHVKTAAGVAVAGAIAVAAWAAAPDDKAAKAPNTPPNWSYEVRNGKPVPRLPRKVNADGSWVEEAKLGNCTVTRTGREGEVREVRKCD
jgi:hypothetical protein